MASGSNPVPFMAPGFNPCTTAVPFWAQITSIPCSKRDCGPTNVSSILAAIVLFLLLVF